MESENQQANTIHHITHLHPLKLVDLRRTRDGNPTPTCHACRQPCADSAYECAPCGYALDTTCARLPRTLRHPAHPPHPLVLLLMPAYQSGAFRCNGCAHDGRAFCYHCAHCQFDLHLPCAALPETLSHQSHPHALILVHEDPHDGQSFMCDLCGGTSESSSQWTYLCRACDYGGHISCFLPVQGSRAELNLIGDPTEYAYYLSFPRPLEYAYMINNVRLMNKLALLKESINNNGAANSRGAGEGSGVPPAGAEEM